jgi:hypothetical protein
MTTSDRLLRPAEICKALLAALDAADGRRQRRKRDQTPDAIGLAVKRQVLERVVKHDPDPERFEEWLVHCARDAEGTESLGAILAMTRAVFDEWRLAREMPEFTAWLECGAPSADAEASAPSSLSAGGPCRENGKEEQQHRRTDDDRRCKRQDFDRGV